jgi:hypothetical protein
MTIMPKNEAVLRIGTEQLARPVKRQAIHMYCPCDWKTGDFCKCLSELHSLKEDAFYEKL